MIHYASKIFQFKNKQIILRNPQVSDAKTMVEYMKQMLSETHYLLREPNEFLSIVEEKVYLQKLEDNPKSIFICAFDQNNMIGSVNIVSSSNRKKIAHRCSLGISVLKEYWSYGIGSKLLEEALTQANKEGYKQVELEVYADNLRAIKLYEKYGFKQYGRLPNAFNIEETMIDSILMVKEF